MNWPKLPRGVATTGLIRRTPAAYARNLTDEGYITASFGSPPPAIGGRPAEPREWGVR